jgi:ribonucleoside-diphosphate reductase alpha chain
VSAKDSIDIQAIFQEYIDQSISKTLNLAPATTFEEYKDLFMYAYKKGLKGFTTFNPEGSMKGILEYNEPVESKDADYVVRRNAPKRPDELECDIHRVTVKGQKIIVLVGKHKGSLYEIFVDDDASNKIDIQYDQGVIKKISRGRYDLVVKNGSEKLIVENLSKNFGGTYGVLARLVSMSLRHGTPLQFVVDQLGKTNEFVGFEKGVSRVLKKYIKDGEKVMTGEVCPECGSELQFKEGCVSCLCGWSRCL